ncbi:unnamed protein product [Bursaphelenchus okinawaensis]|uniref:Na_H_Exchanger domain-containing protein n=1 Tax=Bursaphelenchus okinawaensis TaxID=465554 RepID=A0A811LHG9_9BILA|nr:unnamed protein product [Bursaphelenchus okinawaensis]CAG9125480.1 unnamed protein product [Bursaphelenchus okinawaensis]
MTKFFIRRTISDPPSPAKDLSILEKCIGKFYSVLTYLIFLMFFILAVVSIFKKPINTGFLQFDSLNKHDPNYYSYKSVITLSTVFFAAIAGGFVAKILRLPLLFGMLISGLILRNFAFWKYSLFVHPSLSNFVRKFGFMVVLLRAGLAVDIGALKRFKWTAIWLAIVPSTVEAIFVMLLGYPWLDLAPVFSFLLG